MIVAIASQKGGTGKTTTSITLAAGLARAGKRVLLVDMDSQANSSKVLVADYEKLIDSQNSIVRTILHRQPLAIHESKIENLDVAPSHILLSDTDIELTTAMDHRESRLKSRLDEVAPEYDYVFIDCPPALGWLTINAFTAAEGIIVVVSPGYFELDSLKQISKTLAEVVDLFNPSLELLGFLFTNSEPEVNTRVSLKVLRQTYTDDVFDTIIPKNTDIRKAHFNRTDIFDFKPKAPSAKAYLRLIKEVFGE